MSYICYVLKSDVPKYWNRTYTGITNNSERRLKQHNGGVKKGGAKSTNAIRPVSYFIKIHNLSKGQALSIEKKIHNMKRRKDRKYVGALGSKLCLGLILDRKEVNFKDVQYIGLSR